MRPRSPQWPGEPRGSGAKAGRAESFPAAVGATCASSLLPRQPHPFRNMVRALLHSQLGPVEIFGDLRDDLSGTEEATARRRASALRMRCTLCWAIIRGSLFRESLPAAGTLARLLSGVLDPYWRVIRMGRRAKRTTPRIRPEIVPKQERFPPRRSLSWGCEINQGANFYDRQSSDTCERWRRVSFRSRCNTAQARAVDRTMLA